MGFFDFLFGSKPAVDEFHYSLDNMSDEMIISYFREILKNDFPEYQLKEEVPVTKLVGDACDEFQLYSTRPTQAYKAEWGNPYNFVLYKDGEAVAVVMLGRKGSHNENVKYLISRMYAKKVGLPYINFYTNYPNRKEYVIERIKSFLNK
jgi:hypothetical protein